MTRLVILIMFFSATVYSSYSQNFTYSKDYPKLFLESESNESSYFYPSLKTRFLKEGENFSKEEMLALLVGQTAQKSYNAYGMVGLEKSFLMAEQFPADTILKYGEKVLELNPVSLSLNFGLWKTYQKIQDLTKANIFKKRFELLCETILYTGDGTKNSPYFVISPIDGMVIITKYKENEVTTMGSGENEEGYFLDILGFKSEVQEGTFHFVIDHGMGGLSKMLMEIRQKR